MSLQFNSARNYQSFSSVVKRLSHILHMDGSAVQLCPELPICFQYNDSKQSNNLAPCGRGRQKVSSERYLKSVQQTPNKHLTHQSLPDMMHSLFWQSGLNRLLCNKHITCTQAPVILGFILRILYQPALM